MHCQDCIFSRVNNYMPRRKPVCMQNFKSSTAMVIELRFFMKKKMRLYKKQKKHDWDHKAYHDAPSAILYCAVVQ